MLVKLNQGQEKPAHTQKPLSFAQKPDTPPQKRTSMLVTYQIRWLGF